MKTTDIDLTAKQAAKSNDKARRLLSLRKKLEKR
jgi:hypothetical protein